MRDIRLRADVSEGASSLMIIFVMKEQFLAQCADTVKWVGEYGSPSLPILLGPHRKPDALI